MLDGLLGNETDLPLLQHAADTTGATVANSALFDLVGRQLSPRLRDLGKITCAGPGSEPSSPTAMKTRYGTDIIAGDAPQPE